MIVLIPFLFRTTAVFVVNLIGMRNRQTRILRQKLQEIMITSIFSNPPQPPISGFIYPTFASAVAILKSDDKLIGQWLIYWVVYAGVLVVQRVFSRLGQVQILSRPEIFSSSFTSGLHPFSGVVLDKIPFYPLFNALFLIALMHYPFGGNSHVSVAYIRIGTRLTY